MKLENTSSSSEAYLSKHEIVDSIFVHKGSVRDDEFKRKAIYTIKFNPFLKSRAIFATAVESVLLVFECIEKSSGVKLLQRYKAEGESFYALAWGIAEEQSSPVIAAGGSEKAIRVIVTSGKFERKLLGHSKFLNNHISTDYFGIFNLLSRRY